MTAAFVCINEKAEAVATTEQILVYNWLWLQQQQRPLASFTLPHSSGNGAPEDNSVIAICRVSLNHERRSFTHKNNITLRWSSNHHKTLMLRLPHDISLLSFHYSKLVSIKGLATFQGLFVTTWLMGHLFEQTILVAKWSVEWWCEITNKWLPSSRSYRLGFNESFSNGEWHYCSEKPGFLVRLGHIFDWQLARWRSFRPSMKNAVVVLLCSTPRSRCPTVPKFFFFAETSIFW